MIFPPCPKCGVVGKIYVLVHRDERRVTVECCEGCLVRNVIGDIEFERQVRAGLAEIERQELAEIGATRQFVKKDATGAYIPLERDLKWWGFWK